MFWLYIYIYKDFKTTSLANNYYIFSLLIGIYKGLFSSQKKISLQKGYNTKRNFHILLQKNTWR